MEENDASYRAWEWCNYKEAFFATTPIEEKKGDDNKLVTATHFCLKQKEKKKRVTIASLLTLSCS